MSTEANPTSTPVEPQQAPPTPGDPKGEQIPPQRFEQVNQQKKDAIAKAEALQAELDVLKADKAKADDDRLTADKKFEDLATKRAAERDEWKGKAEAAEARVTEMSTRLHAIADEQLKTLPEKTRARVPAADAADPLARLAKIEELIEQAEELRSETPPRVIPHGIGRGPAPAGPPGGKEAEAEAQAGMSHLLSRW